MKKKFLTLSLITFIMSLVVFGLAFFIFHYVTDAGITFIYHAEAEKPFVANMVGIFGVLSFFTSVISLIIAFIFCKNKNSNDL